MGRGREALRNGPPGFPEWCPAPGPWGWFVLQERPHPKVPLPGVPRHKEEGSPAERLPAR